MWQDIVLHGLLPGGRHHGRGSEVRRRGVRDLPLEIEARGKSTGSILQMQTAAAIRSVSGKLSGSDILTSTWKAWAGRGSSSLLELAASLKQAQELERRAGGGYLWFTSQLPRGLVTTSLPTIPPLAIAAISGLLQVSLSSGCPLFRHSS